MRTINGDAGDRIVNEDNNTSAKDENIEDDIQTERQNSEGGQMKYNNVDVETDSDPDTVIEAGNKESISDGFKTEKIESGVETDLDSHKGEPIRRQYASMNMNIVGIHFYMKNTWRRIYNGLIVLKFQ